MNDFFAKTMLQLFDFEGFFLGWTDSGRFTAGHNAGARGMALTSGKVAVAVLLAALLAWSVAWKGLALWRAARRGDKIWYIVLLLVNTAGVLEIVYLFFVTGAKSSDFRFSGPPKCDP